MLKTPNPGGAPTNKRRHGGADPKTPNLGMTSGRTSNPNDNSHKNWQRVSSSWGGKVSGPRQLTAQGHNGHGNTRGR